MARLFSHKLGKISDKSDSALIESFEQHERYRDAHDPYAQTVPQGFENVHISYMDPRALTRPLDMPTPIKRKLGILLLVAALVGAGMLFVYFDTVVNAQAHLEAAINENLERSVSYKLPFIQDLMKMSDDEMVTSLKAAGDQFYERVSPGSLPEGGFQMVKLPQGVSVEDADRWYSKGINRLGGVDASKLLNGSWDLTVAREGNFEDIIVRYADFSSSTVTQAMQNALLSQALANSKGSESGVDESGNTYTTGTLQDGDTVYTWRVSILPLSEMFNIKGLPKEALYVGIRFSK